MTLRFVLTVVTSGFRRVVTRRKLRIRQPTTLVDPLCMQGTVTSTPNYHLPWRVPNAHVFVSSYDDALRRLKPSYRVTHTVSLWQTRKAPRY